VASRPRRRWVDNEKKIVKPAVEIEKNKNVSDE
jgi:hypothetical protein